MLKETEELSYKCWRISGDFTHSMQSCPKMDPILCNARELKEKCPMGHRVVF